MDDNQTPNGRHRRQILAATGAASAFGLAGCLGSVLDSGEETTTDVTIGQIGSGRDGRDAPGGTPMGEMPALEGELTVYSGRGEFLVGDLLTYIDELYDDFTLVRRYGGSTDLVNQILNEGSGSPADVFFSVNAGALGTLTDEGRTQSLPDDVLETVRAEFRTDEWIGISGRARAVPFNTDAYNRAEMPDSIMTYPDFAGDIGWAPSYGSVQAFVTAMRTIEGEAATREWVRGIADGAKTYPDELAACQAIADGSIDAAFTNHYYVQRVRDANPGAPLATHFTQGDAGAVFNVAGAAIVDAAADSELAATFVRHLLSAEAQDYFARRNFEYPLIPGVEPVGDIPTIDELDVPDIDLTVLSDLEPTIDLMREEGVEI